MCCCLGPDFLGLCLDARDAIENADGTIEDPKRSEDFKRKVCVTRSVDEVDVMRDG